MNLPERILSWYGDDFTGAAAVMEVLQFAGLPAVLFLDSPTEALLARFPGIRAIGLAGDARTRGPDWMRAELPAIFEGLRALGAPVLHYKICSTLDSSPETGSIGLAADLAGDWSALIVAAPRIGRWQAFGTLFARAGDGIHRLDRHPTMSVHPVTPMTEADVRLHLGRQTDRGIGLVDLIDLKSGRGAEALARERRTAALIAFDVMDEETLAAAGSVIWENGPPFLIGSQGIEYALVAAWRAAGLLAPPPDLPDIAPADRIAVVSGSCSPVTAEQISVAEAAGFAVVDLDPVEVETGWERAREQGLRLLGQGRSVILATARGAATHRADAAFNAGIGTGLGRLLDRLALDSGVRRLVVAGGDTSSHATRQLGLFALTAETAVSSGGALLRGWSTDPARDGIGIALKGGQMGPPDFFVRMRTGGPATA